MSDAENSAGHERCGARARQGPCRLPAGWGTDHKGFGRCRKHLGNTANHVKAALHEIAEAEAARLSLPVETTAEAALQTALNRANGHALYLSGQVEALTGDARIWGTAKRTTTSPGEDGEAETTTVEQAGPTVWEALLLQWDKQLLAVAAGMLHAGIEERRTHLEEELGAKIGAALDAALEGLPPDELARRRGVLAGRLRAITG